jgi:hypothetical protein
MLHLLFSPILLATQPYHLTRLTRFPRRGMRCDARLTPFAITDVRLRKPLPRSIHPPLARQLDISGLNREIQRG